MDYSDYQLRTILEASPIPLIISRVADGRILYANQQLADMVGFTVEELVGRTTPEFYADPRDRERLVDRLKSDGTVSGYEIRIKRANGNEIWTMLSLVMAELAGEAVIVGGLYDITDRKRGEEALRESESFMAAVLDTINALVIVLDREGHILRFNRACERVSGYRFEEVVGRCVWDFLLLPEEVEGVRGAFLELAGGTYPTVWENCWVTRSGERRRISWSSTVLSSEDGQVEYVIGTGLDVTERRRAEEELQKKMEELEQINRELREAETQLVQSEKMASLGNLVAGVAHEINTPVGAINSMHDTLVRALDRLQGALEAEFPDAYRENPKVQAALKVIGDANRVIATGTERVTRIVRSLRSFARLDEAELKRVDLHEGIENTLTLVHHDLKNRVRVIKNYGEIPEICCYPSRLNQVFLNILVNAAQAIQGEGEIEISTYKKDKMVCVAFRDTGSGISEENLRRIFDPGFTTKGVGVGTGLGLSICYRIVQDHRGKILVESAEGRGSTFTVVLPTDLGERA